MKPEIYVRTDGNAEIGLGHIVRCLALAYMLKNEFDTTFFCREIPAQVIEELTENRVEFKQIFWENEFLEKVNNKIIVVLDGYHFNVGYQKRIKEKGAKLVCIDDLHNNEFVADIIINHAPGITPQDYKAQYYTQFALGLDYALLRPVFLEQAKKQREIKSIETVMICFGGADPENQTQRTLKIVLELPQFKKIIVVTGAAYCEDDNFEQLLNSDKRIECRKALNETQMLITMLEAELAIIPASSVLLESLAAGCAIIIDYFVDNQKSFHDFLTSEIGITSIHFNTDAKTIIEKYIIQKKYLFDIQNIASYRQRISFSQKNILKIFSTQTL
jgi:UDP-2,4-diacetamido-2,4,6-trideoxy-beta-L-altropyranose hydrolase